MSALAFIYFTIGLGVLYHDADMTNSKDLYEHAMGMVICALLAPFWPAFPTYKFYKRWSTRIES